MVNSWIQAIQEFNQDKKYSVPKKGTPEFDAIKLIQLRIKESSVPVKETVKPVKEPVKNPVKPVKPVKGGDGIKEV